jgi:hypothetical protein
MSMFSVTIEVGDPQGGRFEPIQVLVGTNATYNSLPGSLCVGLTWYRRTIGEFWTGVGPRFPFVVTLSNHSATQVHASISATNWRMRALVPSVGNCRQDNPFAPSEISGQAHHERLGLCRLSRASTSGIVWRSDRLENMINILCYARALLSTSWSSPQSWPGVRRSEIGNWGEE